MRHIMIDGYIDIFVHLIGSHETVERLYAIAYLVRLYVFVLLDK